MAFKVYVCLVLFILTGSHLTSAKDIYKQYASLISDVHTHYKTSSVFFTLSKDDRGLEDYSMVHYLSRIFSKKAVNTLIVNFSEVNERLSFYRKVIARPLVVVLVKSASDIAEFNKSLEEGNKSYPIWLVIFYGYSGNPICEYCIRPVGNMLQLRFDTAMLLVCCNNTQIHEWWSVHENQTEIEPFGVWKANERLNITAAAGLSPRRREVHGTGFRVVIVSTSALIHDYGKCERIGGFLGGVFYELKAVLNFTVTETFRAKEFGGYDKTENTWSGAIGYLVEGKADLVIGDFAITTPRLDAIDLTYPLLSSHNRLFIKRPQGRGVQWSAYFKAFTFEMWETIILLIITITLLLAVVKVKRRSISLLSLGIDNYIRVWGIFCQQGLSEFPPETPLRIVYFSTFVSALVVSAAYSAALISYLTLAPPELPFMTLEGYVEDRSYKLIILRNSSNYDFFTGEMSIFLYWTAEKMENGNAEDFPIEIKSSYLEFLELILGTLQESQDDIYLRMKALMKPWRELPLYMSEAWDQVCNERVAFFATGLDKRTSTIKCPIVEIGSGRADSLALGLPPGSQYTAVINYHIERFRSNGMFSRLRRIYDMHRFDQHKPSYDAVEFSGIAPILSALAGGIILALFILACEHMYHFCKNHGRCWPAGIRSRNPNIQACPNLRRKKKKSSKNLPLVPRLQNGNCDTPLFGYCP